jgi:ATP-dependent Clp protease protease subunit
VEIQAREILRMREELNDILARHTSQPLEKIEKDTERDFFMTGDQAREYGIVDRVIAKRGAPAEIPGQPSVPRLPER